MKEELEIKDKTRLEESFKITPFRKHIRKTTAHRHNNYFEIIYLTKGKGFHTIDTMEYEIKPPVIFTIRKEQVHYWNIQTEPEGFVLIIKKSFIENCLDRDIKALISELSAQSCRFPKDLAATDIFKFLIKEHKEKKSYNKILIEGLLKALLAKLLESDTPGFIKNNRNSVYQKFIDLLTQEIKFTRNVKYYAQLLHTTPQNLNAICRKSKSQSPTQILSQHFISEAKRLLIYTDFSVGEVSAKLDFKDNSHFSKYFKRHTGTTPVEFRKRSN